MASFRYFTGPMDCGKSTLALQIDHTHRSSGRLGRLFTSRDRAGEATISSRLGLRRPAVEVHPTFGFWAYVVTELSAGARIDYVVCDETQFYTSAQVDDLARLVDELDVDVFAVGILTDFQTRLFPGSQRLVELCDSVEVLQVEALCWCGRRATHNARTVDGRMVVEGAQVVVGNTADLAGGDADGTPVAYEVLCRRHHRSGTTRTVARAGLAETLPFDARQVVGPGLFSAPEQHRSDHFPEKEQPVSVRDEVLVEAGELAARLARGGRVTLLDVRGSITGPLGRPEHEAGHLPGAVFVDLETELSGTPGEGGRHPLPEPAVFQEAMRAAGVDDDVEVVAYDAATSLYAARLWWLLTDAGHPRVRVLDGGYAAWVAAGHPVETGPSEAKARGGFVVRPGHRDRVDVDQIMTDPAAFTLVDVRAAERYRGEVEPLDPVAGHIPGAVNRPATLLLDTSARFRPAADVAEAFAGLEGPVLYCGSGITAAQALLALEAAGVEGGRIYPGSWSDWIRDPARPVATGEESGSASS